MTDFAARIRAWRESRGLNQKTAAAELDIDQSYLSKLERGQRAPSYVVLERLAKLDGGGGQTATIAEPPRPYGRTFVREAPAGVVVHKSLTFPGDMFVYDRDQEPSDGDWILATRAGEEPSEARVSPHPIDGQMTAWFRSGQSAPLIDVDVVAVAIEWRRPMKQP